MIRKKLILADEDEQYLREIRCGFMELMPQIDLVTFTKKEKVHSYLEQGKTADILVVDEQLVDEKLKSLSMSMTRIALSTSLTPVDDFEVIKKYQRMEALLNAILLKYAQDSGTLEAIRGNSNTKIAVFYSPAGGTGKTTLSLAMAAAGARSGLRILYLNMEEIDSVKDVLSQTPGCLSDVFLALQAKQTTTIQAGIKLKESIGLESTAGFYYVSGVESISEYEEIKDKEINLLLETIRELSSYELVILDLSSGYCERTKRILDAAHVIFMPVTEEEGSISKLLRFLGESDLHEKYNSLFDKTKLILNKSDVNGPAAGLLPHNIRNRLPCCASIGNLPMLNRRRDILQAGDMLLPLVNPMLQIAIGEVKE